MLKKIWKNKTETSTFHGIKVLTNKRRDSFAKFYIFFFQQFHLVFMGNGLNLLRWYYFVLYNIKLNCTRTLSSAVEIYVCKTHTYS